MAGFTACYPLDSAFYWDNLTTQDGTYNFCNGWIETQVPKCTACLEAGTTKYLMNYVTVLDAACSQLPAIGSTLSVQGTPFSTVRMNVTTPSQPSDYTYTPSHSAISLGGKVGIAIGGLVFVLALAGIGIVCIGRRRRRAYLRSLEKRYGQTVWPSPNAGYPGTDMFETPTSQKPLRGWDNHSPMTASSDNNQFSRYYSPYSSQYNSPVTAADAKHHAWPAVGSIPDAFSPSGSDLMFKSYTGAEIDPGVGSSNSASQHYSPTQERFERVAHERELAQIGHAVDSSSPGISRLSSNMSGGATHDDSYLSKSSQPIVGFSQVPSSGMFAKETQGNNESYELREIDSNGNPIAGPSASVPALRHPGYGRSGHSPTSSGSSTPYGGLTEADAKSVKAV
ncbi:hypothetical protein CMQ_105 [Grosmannia clavigera kw1407]|uniref:Lpxtg-domain-containing protein n=1 Tax=Grosmannia clavigera (strain kw1407 / UAMH 11150) TaxID=655863 RepID=F0XRA8_GROCL|nr:uncharacterized protein CMQ_105 [Grosmannia clavigera kw1407]EFW99787.1 hypothetical protein CMQ_105 [Grosmannia clavigera kw1407]